MYTYTYIYIYVHTFTHNVCKVVVNPSSSGVSGFLQACADLGSSWPPCVGQAYRALGVQLREFRVQGLGLGFRL